MPRSHNAVADFTPYPSFGRSLTHVYPLRSSVALTALLPEQNRGSAEEEMTVLAMQKPVCVAQGGMSAVADGLFSLLTRLSDRPGA